MQIFTGKPKVGDYFEAYFGRQFTELSQVVEWRGNRCFFSNGYYLVWSDASGFLF